MMISRDAIGRTQGQPAAARAARPRAKTAPKQADVEDELSDSTPQPRSQWEAGEPDGRSLLACWGLAANYSTAPPVAAGPLPSSQRQFSVLGSQFSVGVVGAE